jgi:hypothetical protein
MSREYEIEKLRLQEQSKAGLSAARRDAAEKEREMRQFLRQAEKIKKARNERAFGDLVRKAGFREDSKQWKFAWDYFYDRL